MGLGGGFGAISIAAGSVTAPLIAAALAPLFGWRSIFVVTGVLGLLWIPLWGGVSARAPSIAAEEAAAAHAEARHLIRDIRLWSIAIAYCLVFTLYTLWANWTTIYLVQERHLTQAQANARYAWFPPAFAVLGGFFAGALAFYWIRGGVPAVVARMRTCWVTAPFLICGAAIPFLPGAGLAAAAIGASFLAFQSLLGTLFLLPLDLFGARRAGFTNSLLAFFAAGTQVLVSPAVGAIIDHVGFTALCLAVPLLPLSGLTLLQMSLRAAPAALSASPAR